MIPALLARFTSRRSSATATLVVALCLAPSPVSAQTTDAGTDDTAACPARVIVAFQATSGRTYAGTAMRGADSNLFAVFYRFDRIPDLSKTWEASGNFYVFGVECRLATYLSFWGVLQPPMERIQYAESPKVACAGGNGGTAFQTVSYPSYDPYGDLDAQCGDGGPSNGGGLTCYQMWIEIQRSDDDGKTWYTFWAGWATVCE